MALHEYIRDKILKQNRPWKTREELEQVATSLEPVLTPPERIKGLKKTHTVTAPPTGRVASKPTPRNKDRARAATRSVVGFAKRKRWVPTTSNPSKAQKTDQKTAPSTTTPKAKPSSTPAPDRSNWECYNCHKKSRILKDCPQPKAGAGEVSGQ